MTDPKRWLDPEGDATALERAVLGRAEGFEPPRGADAKVWASVVGAVGGTVATGAAAAGGGALGSGGTLATGTAASGTGAGGAALGARAALAIPAWLKVFAAGFASGLVVTGGIVLSLSPRDSVPPDGAAAGTTGATAPLARVAREGAELRAPVNDDPGSARGPWPERRAGSVGPRDAARGAAAGSARSVAAPEHGPAGAPDRQAEEPAAVASFEPLAAASADPDPGSRLRDEAAALNAARTALRIGDAARALTLLASADQKFGVGVLSQEREALTIEALRVVGRSAEARARAAAFLSAHAESPHAAVVRRALAAP